VRIEEFDVSGNEVSGLHGETKRYQDFLVDGQFDLIMNYAAQQWSADLAYAVLDRLPYRKVLAPCGFSGLYDQKYKNYFESLPKTLERYEHLVFHSGTYRDIEFAREHGMSRHSIIPNGASAEEFEAADGTFRQLHGIPEETPLLLSVCNHTPAKGHGLVMEAFRLADTGPAVLVVLGKAIGRLSCRPICRLKGSLMTLASRGRKRVLLLEVPRAETLAAYKAADLFVFGSHIECSPLVLFEAVASKTPFISTACGNAEEIAAWTGGGVIVPTTSNTDGTVRAEPRAMAGMIEELLRDGGRRRNMAEAGFSAWRERFTWDRIADQYEQLYQTLVA
jgi:glycosyltransferase involved in cell wall biosynthesis